MRVTPPTAEQLQFAQDLTYIMALRYKTYDEDTSLREEYTLPDLEQAIAAVAGEPVVVHSMNPNYIRAQNGRPRYVAKGLPHSYIGTEAIGTVQRIASLPPYREGGRRRVCLQVGPLALLRDPAWRTFYKARGPLDQYYHPYADDEFHRRMVWIPLAGILERKLFFPTTPLESTYGTRPIRI